MRSTLQILLVLFLCFFLPLGAEAQDPAFNPDEFVLHIRKATGKIELDGKLDEADWKSAETATRFFCNAPTDTSYCKLATEAWVTYDDVNFYVGARCQRLRGSEFVVTSLKRDFSFPVSDGFGVFIDPFNDKTNGFAFTLNPLGVQREGLLQNGGGFGVTTDWDNRWFSKVTHDEFEYVVEIAIPFKTLRYKSGTAEWRINFARNDLPANEQSSWVPVPRSFNIASLAYTGRLIWDEPLGKAGFNMSLIPYGMAGYYADYGAQTSSFDPNAGADAKVSVTPSLNLDLTVNPDFSQVEVDRQVTNLSRFNLFFPERRQFFIENSDLFANFGFRAIRPFFSRKIGLENGTAIPILGGMRLSGKLNNNWRIGVMDMQTEGGAIPGMPGQNYAVATLQRKVFNRSYISAIVVNRQAFDKFSLMKGNFNTVAGLEYNLASKDNKWQGKGFYLRSFDSLSNKLKSANAVWLAYNTRKWFIMYNHEWVDSNFNAETGFVPRVGYLRFEPEVRYSFLPKKGKIFMHGPDFYGSQYFDNRNFRFTDNEMRFRYSVGFDNRAGMGIQYTQFYTWLYFPFDPTRSGQVPLEDSTGYNYGMFSADYASDFRKTFNYKVSAAYGTYFTGTRLQLNGEVNLRTQPWGVFSLAVDLNYFNLNDTTVMLALVSPRVELSFTRSLFFTTFFQWNTQTHNFNINARLQWRFKPMSDLFIVLTDNYATDDLHVKNRALVLKLNYWFSL